MVYEMHRRHSPKQKKEMIEVSGYFFTITKSKMLVQCTSAWTVAKINLIVFKKL